jgi:hypothetical protein
MAAARAKVEEGCSFRVGQGGRGEGGRGRYYGPLTWHYYGMKLLYRSPEVENPLPKSIHAKTPPVNLYRTHNSPPSYNSAPDMNSPIFYRRDMTLMQNEYYPSNFEHSAHGVRSFMRYSKELPFAGSPSTPFDFCQNETRNPQQIYAGTVYWSAQRS